MTLEVKVPRINANEDELLLVSWSVAAGDRVAAGDELCALESTKSAETVVAEAGGFVLEPRGEAGDMVQVGARLLLISESAEAVSRVASEVPDAGEQAASAGMTAKQRLLARKQQHRSGPSLTELDMPASANLSWVVDARKVLGEQGGASTHDPVESNCCFIDATARLADSCRIRATRVYIGAGAKVGPGTIIDTEEFVLAAGAHIASEVCVDLAGGAHDDSRLLVGPASLVGSRACINTCREVLLETASAVSPAAYLFTHSFWQSVLDGYSARFEPVRVGEDAWVGAGCQVLPGVTIGSGAVVISNSTVVADVPAEHMVGGVPAEVIRSQIKRPLDPGAADAKLREVVETAIEHLLRQGCTREGNAIVTPAGGRYQVDLCEGRVIRLQSGDAAWTFDCANHTFAGRDDRIAHELRNVLRRHGIRFQPYDWDASYRGPLTDA